jgi:hypothetical protein
MCRCGVDTVSAAIRTTDLGEQAPARPPRRLGQDAAGRGEIGTLRRGPSERRKIRARLRVDSVPSPGYKRARDRDAHAWSGPARSCEPARVPPLVRQVRAGRERVEKSGLPAGGGPAGWGRGCACLATGCSGSNVATSRGRPRPIDTSRFAEHGEPGVWAPRQAASAQTPRRFVIRKPRSVPLPGAGRAARSAVAGRQPEAEAARAGPCRRGA